LLQDVDHGRSCPDSAPRPLRFSIILSVPSISLLTDISFLGGTVTYNLRVNHTRLHLTRFPPLVSPLSRHLPSTMLANPLHFFVLALAAIVVGVSAQTPISPCILSCSEAGVAEGTCSSPTDLACVCNSPAFQNAVTNCLTTPCTAEEQNVAIELQQQNCASSLSANVDGST